MIKYFSGTKYFCAAADLKWRDQSGGGLASVLGARLLARARRTHVPGTSIVTHVPGTSIVIHVALARVEQRHERWRDTRYWRGRDTYHMRY